MKKYIKIINIIDRSGSMEEKKDATIEGFNSFINDQKSIDGNVLVSTVMFSNIYNILFEDVDLYKIDGLNNENYKTGGSTALYDAIGKTIQTEIDKLGKLPLEERPEKTLCVILTDGEENSSHSYNKDQIKNIINEMRTEFNWEFIFLGASEEASTTAEGMGIARGNSMSFSDNSVGVTHAYNSISKATKLYRTVAKASMDNLMNDNK
jgi:hypothetical protein